MGCCATKDSTHVPSPTQDKKKPSSGVKQVSKSKVKPAVASAGTISTSESTTGIKLRRAEGTKSLNLEGAKLTSPPAEIGNISGLKSLDLHDNKITTIPNWNMPALKLLDLSSNCISLLPMMVLPSVTTVKIAGNRLQSIPDIDSFKSLKELDLSNNNITTIGALPNLIHTLRLNGNPLDVVPVSVFELKKLTTLDMSYTRIRSIGSDEEISKLMSLKHLILNHTNISDLSAALFDATPMSKLDIEGCPFTESDLRKKDFYPNWMDKRAGTINKKIQGGAEFQLMK